LPAALGWLLAGNDALALSNLDDERLTRLALESLPQPLRPNRRTLLESRVHRWVGTVNGLPGGNPVTDMRSRHCPDPNARPCVYLVGDYMFDSTLNGVCDSASYVAELLMTRLRTEKYRPDLRTDGGAPPPARRRRPRLHRSYFQYYDGEKSYERSFGEYFSAEEVEDLIAAVWGCRPPYRLLDCGSASGLTLKAFHRQGIEAWGIENNSYIHQRTPRAWKSRNLFGDVRRLPFPDQFFDFAHDTCLCYLAEDDLDSALSELFRVSRVGVIFGSISADVPAELIEETEMFYGMHSLHTLWQWSEKFIASGFRLAVSDPVTLEKAWDVTLRYAEDGPVWYPDKESFRYCFYSKPEVPRFLAGRAGARR
jgi:SAM-dependent methyltransferase